MIPNNWVLAPQLRFPFSGSVTQDISPDTNWFFGSIPPEAGVGRIEKEVFDVASYGKQLGLILDVLMPMIGEGSPDSDDAAQAREKLKALYRRIEETKTRKKNDLEEAAIALLRRIERTDRDMLSRVVGRFER